MIRASYVGSDPFFFYHAFYTYQSVFFAVICITRVILIKFAINNKDLTVPHDAYEIITPLSFPAICGPCR